MISTLADGSPVTDTTGSPVLRKIITHGSIDGNLVRVGILVSQLVRLITSLDNVPPRERVWNLNIQELLQQINNAVQGKRVRADTVILEILQVLMEDVIELCGGYISHNFKDYSWNQFMRNNHDAVTTETASTCCS